MSAKSIELADAIAAHLNDNDFEFQFEARRRHAPLSSEELEKLKGVLILVFAGPVALERVTRGRFKRTYKPIIAIHRRLNGASLEANEVLADKLVELTEQIAESLEDTDMEAGGEPLILNSFSDEQDNDLYSAEAMQTANIFIHATRLEYTTG